MSRLDPRFTFKRFVASPANRHAYLAALAVSKGTMASANPLFIYGPSGVGKTHLASAICSGAVNQRNVHTFFASEEEFVHRMIEALRADGHAEFFRDLAATRLLVIEDVHFLGGRVRTQEEFCERLSFARRMGCQIVLTSDRPPNQISEIISLLEAFLVSGLTVRLTQPDFHTLVKITRLACSRRGLVWSNKVVRQIAQASSNIRQVEGHLTRSEFCQRAFGLTPHP